MLDHWLSKRPTHAYIAEGLHDIDGTQAEYVKIPYAGTSLYTLAPSLDEEVDTHFSDILPTGHECGVLNGQVRPGVVVTIVGAGPVGLATLLTAKLYSAAERLMIEIRNRNSDARQTPNIETRLLSG